PATTTLCTLSLHDALPISAVAIGHWIPRGYAWRAIAAGLLGAASVLCSAPGAWLAVGMSAGLLAGLILLLLSRNDASPSAASSPDRKSTRLNSSHVSISYA